MPDGTEWTSDTDINKFTDPKHPAFPSTLEKINTIRKKMKIKPIEIDSEWQLLIDDIPQEPEDSWYLLKN